MDNKLSELSKPVAWSWIGYPNRKQLTWVQPENWKNPIALSPLYSQEYVSALLEKSKEKDERTIACVNAFEGIDTERIAGKSLGEFLAGELYLNKAEPKQDGSFGFTFSGLAVQLMADCFADQFKSSGAINYLELLFEHAEVGEMTVTMQRVEGLTPAQKLAAAEQRIAELEAYNARLREWNAGLAQESCELQAKLATPVRLPNKSDDEFWFDGVFQVAKFDRAVERAISAAGFKFVGDEQ